MIKKILPFVLFLPFLSACRKSETGFDMSYRRTFEIPVGLNPAKSHSYVLLNIPADTSVFFTINNANASQLIGVVPRSMNIRTVYPGTGNTFAIVNQVEVFIFDPTRPDIPEIPIFYRRDIPLNTGDRLDLVPDGTNISKFVLDGRIFNIRIKLTFLDFTPRSVDTEANIVFLAKTS
jgi:hypothetical protein